MVYQMLKASTSEGRPNNQPNPVPRNVAGRLTSTDRN
jgi:hypothetical protein